MNSSSNILAEAVARKKLLLQDISFLNGVISSLSQSPVVATHSAAVYVSPVRCERARRAEIERREDAQENGQWRGNNDEKSMPSIKESCSPFTSKQLLVITLLLLLHQP